MMNKCSNIEISMGLDQQQREEIQEFLCIEYTMQDLPQLITAIFDQDAIKQHYGIIGIRKIISLSSNPFQQLDQDVILRILMLADQSQYPQLQLEALRIFTIVLRNSRELNKIIAQMKGIASFVKLINSKYEKVSEQAAYIIGNMVLNQLFRKQIIEEGGLINVIEKMKLTVDQQARKCYCYVISNICKQCTSLPYQQVREAIRILSEAIAQEWCSDRQTYTNMLMAISINSCNVDFPQKLNHLFLRKILKSLEQRAIIGDYHSLRILLNISTNRAEQLCRLIPEEFLTTILKFLTEGSVLVKIVSSKLLANLCTNASMAEKVVKKPKVLKTVLSAFKNSLYEIKFEIMTLCTNLALKAPSKELFGIFTAQKIMDSSIQLLKLKDQQTMERLLLSLQTIFQFGSQYSKDKDNQPVMQFVAAGGVLIFQELQACQSQKIFNYISIVRSCYFSDV